MRIPTKAALLFLTLSASIAFGRTVNEEYDPGVITRSEIRAPTRELPREIELADEEDLHKRVFLEGYTQLSTFSVDGSQKDALRAAAGRGADLASVVVCKIGTRTDERVEVVQRDNNNRPIRWKPCYVFEDIEGICVKVFARNAEAGLQQGWAASAAMPPDIIHQYLERGVRPGADDVTRFLEHALIGPFGSARSSTGDRAVRRPMRLASVICTPRSACCCHMARSPGRTRSR